MPITTVLFDLDGTLLPMDQDEFVKDYFGRLAAYLAPHGYEAKPLIDAIWKGTAAMIRNRGEKTNEAVFWDCFCALYGEDARRDIPLFDQFYRTEFQKVRQICGYTPKSAELISLLADRGMRLVLATNPIFPTVATESRIRWAGLRLEDFELYTTYENISHCKPNPAYYADILARIGEQPENCLMVGNDVGDDMVAETLGMQVFLLTDCLINKENADLSRYPHGDFDALLAHVAQL